RGRPFGARPRPRAPYQPGDGREGVPAAHGRRRPDRSPRRRDLRGGEAAGHEQGGTRAPASRGGGPIREPGRDGRSHRGGRRRSCRSRVAERSPGVKDPIRIEGLSVRYRRATACADVSLVVPPGAVYALLGRNGAGKSSLVRCLLGQQKPSTGQARLFGENSWTTRCAAMARIGVVPEEPDAPPALSARTLSDFCRRIYPRWDSGAVSERLRRFEVPAATPFGKLSKGQRGQVMLALALGHSP